MGRGIDFNQEIKLIFIKKMWRRGTNQKDCASAVLKKSRGAKFSRNAVHLTSVNCTLVQIG
jgi:hypothetical protein